MAFDKVHLTPQKRLQILQKLEIHLVEFSVLTLFKFDDKVNIALFRIELVAEGGTDEKQASDLVLSAQVGDGVEVVADEGDHQAILEREGRCRPVQGVCAVGSDCAWRTR